MSDLFEQQENGDVRVDLSIKVIKEFADLINRDKDRKKRLSTAEMAWIFHVNSPKSPYALQTNREEKVAGDLEHLPDNWKPDDVVKKASDKFIELFVNTSSVRLLGSLRDSLNSADKLIRTLHERIDTLLSAEEPPIGDELDEAVGYLESLLKIADKLPGTLNKIRDVEDKVRKEQASVEKSKRGGGSVGYFEDPR